MRSDNTQGSDSSPFDMSVPWTFPATCKGEASATHLCYSSLCEFTLHYVYHCEGVVLVPPQCILLSSKATAIRNDNGYQFR